MLKTLGRLSADTLKSPPKSGFFTTRYELYSDAVSEFVLRFDMEKENKKPNRRIGRKPKDNPAVFRYSISFNAADHARFLALFEQSGMKVKAHFITASLFDKPVKTVKIDKAGMDFYMRLTTLYSQYRAVGVNYNQVVKALKTNFTEKKALAFLYKLEKQTIELIEITQKIVALTEEFKLKFG